MKNPFIAMALMAAMMAAAFRENVARSMHGYAPAGKTVRARIPGKRNPAGSKIARKFAKHTGHFWNGEIVHGGELTAMNQARAARRAKVAT